MGSQEMYVKDGLTWIPLKSWKPILNFLAQYSLLTSRKRISTPLDMG